MTGQVVEDDDVSAAEGEDELGLDVALEDHAVHGPVDHPSGVDPVVTQGGDGGLGAPVTEGRVVDETVADRCPAGGLDHVRLQGRLIDEDQPVQGLAHEGLAPGDPEPAGAGDVRPLLLGGEQGFFCG